MIEYVIVVGVIALVMFAMNPMIKRSAQGMIKSMADQIGTQENAEQDFSPTTSHLESSYSSTRAIIEKQRLEQPGGIITYVFNEETRIDSSTYTNLGFRPD